MLDVSKGYTAIDMIALEIANHILLTTQLSLPCLRNVARLLTSFDNMNDRNTLAVCRGFGR